MSEENTQPHTDRKLLSKAFKILLGTLFLMFLSPFIITLGFKEDLTPIWVVGLILGLMTIALGFAGFKTLIKAFFGNSKPSGN